MNHSKRAFQRTVVFLDKRHRSVPNKTELGRLATAKRISDISFTKNDSSSQIGDLLVRAFPPLTGKDLSSLEIITSYARGHAMRTVATGLQSGVQLMDHFGGSRRKRSLYFYQVKVCLHLKCYLHQLHVNLTSAYYLNCSLQMEHVLNKHSLIYNQFSMKLIFLLDTLLTYLSKVTFPAALQLLAQINRKIINLQILSRTFRRNWSFVISSP